MRCPKCHAANVEEDLDCRQCGADLLPASTSLVTTHNNFPALLYNSPVPRGVAASVGALALGFGIELLRRNILSRLRPIGAAKRALPATLSLKDVLHPQSNKPAKLPRGYEMHETIVYISRVIRPEN